MRNGEMTKVFCLLLLLLGWMGCSSGAGSRDGGEDGADIPDALERFAEAFAGKMCEVYAECGCLPEVEAEFCRYRVKSAAAGFLTSDWLGGMEFHEDCTQSILDAIGEYGCSVHLLSWERLGIGEGCADFCSLLTGEASAGGTCRGEDLYHYPLSDCPAGLVCDASGVCVDPCQAWFSGKLAEGGECERGWEVIGECADGLVCDSRGTDTCIPLPGRDQPCLYDQCLPGLYCEILVTTKTCRGKGSDGESCRDNDECYSNLCESDHCVGGAPPNQAVCEYLREILEIDDPGLPDASMADMTVAEGNSGTTELVFTLQLSKPSDREISVDVKTVDDTACSIGEQDYTATEETLTIPAGETSRDLTVVVKGDPYYEQDDTFFVELSNPVFANLATGRATGTITNDDPLPELSISDVTVQEGDDQSNLVDFVVDLSAPAGVSVVVSWETQDGTALSRGDPNPDYRRAYGQLTILPTETQGRTEDIQIWGEQIFEPDEIFYVNLFDPVNAAIADGQAACTLLNDDDIPDLSVRDVAHLEGDQGETPYLFWLQLSQPHSQPVSLDVATVGVSATAGQDFAAVSGTFTLEPGRDALPVIVTVYPDLDPEGEETFELVLSNVQNANLAADRAVGTIGDDDSGSIIYVDANAAGAGDGSSWADAFTHPHDGLEAALAGDRLWVAAGTYRSALYDSRNGAFTLKEGVAMYGGFAGTETLLSQRDWQAHPTVLTGDMQTGERAYNVVRAVDLDLAILDGFHVTRGSANGEEYDQPKHGGGLEIVRSSPRISNCIFRDNRAIASGAVYAHGRPVFANCSFYKNDASEHASGALGNSAGDRPSLFGCLFVGNYAQLGGGAMAGNGYYIRDCIFAANRTGNDGGALLIGGSVVENCLIVGNQAQNGAAGGIKVSWNTRVTNSTISGNVGSHSGGVQVEAFLTLTNSILWGNYRWASDLVADELAVPQGMALVTNSDICGGWDGSAVNVNEDAYLSDNGTGSNIDADPLFVGGASGTWTATCQYDEQTQQTTLTDDNASWSGDLRGRYLNPDTLGESQYHITNLQFFIVDNTATTITVLGFALANVGDSYQIHDHHLLPDSPCIDAGTPLGAPETDLEGAPRDANPDLGAYEAG